MDCTGKEFVFDVILDEKDICNMRRELDLLEKVCSTGRRAVVYGMRNTGKTSLATSLLIPRFLAKNSGAIAIYVDFMAVETLEDIARRLRAAFEKAVVRSFPVRTSAQKLMAGFASLRPNLSTDTSGNVSLSLTTQSGTAPTIQEIFVELEQKARQSSLLLVLDEFQDISDVPTAEALFRGALQKFPHQTPVIIMGSKKHLLTNMFARPKAPFHNWGEDIEIEPIPFDEYHIYMNERFQRFGLSIDLNTSQKIQERLLRNPETINMVCRSLVEILCGNKSIVREADVEPAIAHTVERRAKRFEQFLAIFSPGEQKVLIELARTPGVISMQGKDFVARVGFSSTTVKKAKKRLETDAIIQLIKGKYYIADALLTAYLRIGR